MNRFAGVDVVRMLGVVLLAIATGTLAAESPGKLRSEMAKAERQFIDLYNKVNSNPEFAIVCRMDKPTGTSFAVRVCQPKYLMTETARAASERFQSAVAAGNSTGAANSNGPNVGAGFAAGSAGSTAGDKEAAFKQHMLELLNKNPELQALGTKRDELQARYDETMKAKGGR
jgi:hypothetical protein